MCLIPAGKWSGRLLLPCAALAVALLAPPLDAKNRDADESRMQARQVDFPSSHSDRLHPPVDRVDWRYFKLEEEQDCAIEVTFESEDADGGLELVGATGDEIASKAISGATASIERTLDPGVYYVSVAASEQTSYELSIDG